MSNERALVKKVDLEGLLLILTDLWNKGVDYIDISANEEGDRLAIYFTEDYLSDEAIEELNNEEEEGTDISDLDINQLI